MKAAQKLAAFVVGLVAVFAFAVWVGKAVDPKDDVAVAHAPVLDGNGTWRVPVDDGDSAPAPQPADTGH